jgi:UDP-N-acetylmuramoylalanine--D-glutamate ligase
LRGDHNYQNALAAYAVCREMGVAHEIVIGALKTFPGLPHRQFQVRIIDHVVYINDSKATNAESAAKALMSYDDIYWIVGGRPKEGGLAGLESLKGRIRKAYLIGESSSDFAQWMKKNNISYDVSGTLEVATTAAHLQAHKDHNAGQKPGVVLLAPACASFDQFTSYEDRGDQFSRFVNGFSERVI